ncbi:hypothetical protein AAG570_003048 [Ranatra chinensis]|uniref:Uncharacterized protein n=1 Tax=Ranatra chinensis TaxID=642074 RepID=A0ABD0Y699_9HEMI
MTNKKLFHFCLHPKGPDGFLVRQLSECEDSGTGEFAMVGNRIRRVNRTTYLYTGTFVLPREVDDDYKMSIIVAVFGNGGWKMSKMGFNLGGVCTMMKTYIPKMMKHFLGDKFGIPPPYCPIPPTETGGILKVRGRANMEGGAKLLSQAPLTSAAFAKKCVA